MAAANHHLRWIELTMTLQTARLEALDADAKDAANEACKK